jgi:hypothetical protein
MTHIDAGRPEKKAQPRGEVPQAVVVEGGLTFFQVVDQ